MKNSVLLFVLLIGVGTLFNVSGCKNKETKTTDVQTQEDPSYPWPLLQSYVDSLDKDYVMGKFSPEDHPDFLLIPTDLADRDDRILHKETLAAYKKMETAAREDSIYLKIISATRNFANQKSIWEAKWNGKRLLEGKEDARTITDPKERALAILRWSSMPGSSRHHWGTDIDLNALNNEYFDEGEGQKIYAWLEEHAWDYGFGQPYTVKDTLRPNGYNEERWHWSYLPLSIPLVRKAMDELHDEDIQGFDGSETASDIHIVDNYVLGINPLLR